MQVSLVSADKSTKSQPIEISEEIFNQKFNEPLVHQVVTAFLAKARQGTKAQKTRSEVRGGGKKPWKQKGSGRARAGTTRSPIWRKGGVTFAAKPRDHSQKVNRKMYKAAMQSILSELIRQDRLLVTNDFAIDNYKTKTLLEKLKAFNLDDVLIILDNVEDNMYLASRNLKNVNVCDVTAADPVSLISYEKVIITVTALKQFEEVLAKQ